MGENIRKNKRKKVRIMRNSEGNPVCMLKIGEKCLENRKGHFFRKCLWVIRKGKCFSTHSFLIFTSWWKMYARKWPLPLCVYSVDQSQYITVGPTRVCVKMLNGGVVYSWGMPPFHADIAFFLLSGPSYSTSLVPIIFLFLFTVLRGIRIQNLLHFLYPFRVFLLKH